MVSGVDYETIEIGQVVLWRGFDGLYIAIWRKNGNWSVPLAVFQGKDPVEVAAFLEEHAVCSKCGITLPEAGPAGNHFAGHFCSTCWEDYKRKNARKCGVCHQPLYKCHC